MGYMFVVFYLKDDFVGSCLFYGNCLEGMVVGFVIEKCLGKKG